MKLATITNHIIITVSCVLFTGTILAKDPQPLPETSHDGLVLKRDSKAAIVYIDPEADFSQYNKVMILEAGVAFKKNWKRDHRRDNNMVCNGS